MSMYEELHLFLEKAALDGNAMVEVHLKRNHLYGGNVLVSDSIWIDESADELTWMFGDGCIPFSDILSAKRLDTHEVCTVSALPNRH